MAMSDCPRCWNTPCTCGYLDPKNWELRKLEGEVERLKKVMEEKSQSSIPESLSVLAKRKYRNIEISIKTYYGYGISISSENCLDIEQEARQYLESLPDKGSEK